MPVLDRVISRFRRRDSAALSIVPKEVPIINDGAGNRPSITITGTVTGLPPASWTPWTYVPQVTEGYVRNSDVYACVSLIAQAAKQVKWWTGNQDQRAMLSAEDRYKAIGGSFAGLDILPDAQARTNFLKAVSPAESIKLLTRAGGPDFIEAWVSYLLLSGNDYWEVERVQGRPSMLFLLRPDAVSAWPINYDARHAVDVVQAWKVRSPYGRTRQLIPYTAERPKGDLIQSKLFNPLDPIYGMAPLTAALLAVDMANEGAALFKRIMQRGYSPGWIQADKDSIWEEAQVAKLRERVKASKQAGEELFLENAEWHQMGFPPVDSGIAQQSILSKRDIASVFHVDPALIGDTSTRTYATYRESRQALYMEAVIPLLLQFRADWNETIGRELGSPLDFDKDSFDAITAARAEATDRVVKLWQAGLITQNEARADLEYDPAAPGDVFYAPANYIPLGESVTAEPAAAPAPAGE